MLSKIKLAMLIYGVCNNTKRDISLEKFISERIELDEFECKVREQDMCQLTIHRHLQLLINNNILEVVGGGKGQKASLYRFNSAFKKMCLEKEYLLKWLKVKL